MSGIRGRSSPLRGRYLVRNRPWNLFLAMADRLVGAVVRNEAPRVPSQLRRVLVAVGGHLGDAVIATSAVSLLRRALPTTEIGIVVGSWAKPVIEGHPAVKWIHTVDHWRQDRSEASLATRWLRDRATRRLAIRAIRAVGYDAAIDFYMYYPNMAGLLWRADIPVRVGFASGGYSSLYTHAVDWVDADEQVAYQQASLLRVLDPGFADPGVLRYDLPAVPSETRLRTEEILSRVGTAPGGYVVVHMGARSALKEWSRERWRELASRLVADGHQLVFTGTGYADQLNAAEVTRGLPKCTDLTGQLGWSEFIHVLSRAKLVLSVDTVAAHLAAAVGTPCVGLWTGMSRTEHWRPLGSDCTVLMNPVPCAPCFRSRGCESMACIRGLSVDTVWSAVQTRLTSSGQAEPLSDQTELEAARR